MQKRVINGKEYTIPDSEATGDLTVERKDSMKDEVKEETKEVKKELIPLPEIGETFMLRGHEYKVVYLNPGKQRFTCEPHKGMY